jgi:two-component system, NarL family, response regulator DevR
MNESTPLRLLLVDDHPMVRAGLRSLLAQLDPEMSVSEAGNVEEAIMEAERSRPDVVVMDVRLGEGSGIEATREIRNRRPETQVLMFTSYADDEALMASVMAGASGFVLKEVRTGKLLRAIREVAAGKNLLDEDTIGQMFEQLRGTSRHSGDDRLARLTEREDGVLNLVAEGKTNREIGTELGLSEKTVKNYLSNILGKLEVQRRSEAAAYAARHYPTPQG